MNVIVPDNLPEAIKAGQMAEQTYTLALAVKVDCPEMFEIAGEELRSIVTKRKDIEAMRLSITRPMDEAKARVMDLFRAPTERLAEAEKLLRVEMTGYQRAEQEKADKLRREAEERDRAEREQHARQQREAEAAQQKAREEAEAARSSGDEAAAAAAEAAAAAASEQAEAAREQIELSEIAPPAQIATIAPKASGISARKNWKAEVTDFKSLVLAAAKRAEAGDDFLLGFLLPNEKALNASAKSMQARLSVPGVRVYADDVLSVRRA